MPERRVVKRFADEDLILDERALMTPRDFVEQKLERLGVSKIRTLRPEMAISLPAVEEKVVVDARVERAPSLTHEEALAGSTPAPGTTGKRKGRRCAACDSVMDVLEGLSKDIRPTPAVEAPA